MGYILGLDLGITSVGWGIIEEDNYNVVDYGVRLFEEGNADNNLKRRTMRGSRRLKSRRRNRINAIKYYLLQIGIIKSIDFEPMNNVYELRVKGLTEKLSNIELANVLVNIAKHRGSSLDVAVDTDNKDDMASSSALTANTKELIKRDMYVCELQLERYNKTGQIRNTNNIFKTSDYEKELRKILSNQNLMDEQIEKIVSIVIRRRDFSEGPGSKEFPTKYGSYRLEIEDGIEVIKHVNLIDMMKGKCSIFPEESRIAKNTYEACLFNLLNDLNNLSYIKDEIQVKLSAEQKKQLINDYINIKGELKPKDVANFLGVDLESISGFRIDTKEKPLLSTFDVYKKMIKDGINTAFLANHEAFDKVIEEITKNQIVEKRIDAIKKLCVGLSDEEINKIANYAKVNGYHSLSKKAMDIIIPELFDTNKNQMQIITDNKLNTKHLSFGGNEIEFDDTAILSPVAARVHRQAIKVVNALRKEYGEFSSVVIETTRAKNSAEEKKMIQDEQKRFEQQKSNSDTLLQDLGKKPNEVNSLTRLKIKLYNEQNCKTIYNGETIDLDRLLNDPTAYQIEHIIPYSISFDNSLNNKALASAKENQDKGNMTPFMYFKSGKVNGPINTFEQFESIIKSLYDNKQITKQKMLNLLNQEDITKFSNMQEFVARNLNDTSYGIKTVMNTMKTFYNVKNINTKVFTVKGKNTHAFRSRFGLAKDRDDYIHHAVDALIIAGFKNQKVFNQAFDLETEDDVIYMKSTGEVVNLENPFEDSKFIIYLKRLKSIEGSPFDFSWALDTKTNRQFSDETIYSTRKYDDKEYIIKKYKDIYGKDGESLKKLIDKGEGNKLLMAKNDQQTYELFKKIVEAYPNEKNPFAKYKEENGPIRKVSKKNNGPIINDVKYVDSALGNYLDISSKYNTNGDKKVILLQITPYRTDIYRNKEGLYKFVTVRRCHIKQVDGKNSIDKVLYDKLKMNKGITDQYEYLFSLNRNNIIKLVDKANIQDSVNNPGDYMFRFKVTKSEDTNVIEVSRINKADEKRLTPTIGRSTAILEKYNVSPTGKYQKVDKETLKLEW